MKYNCGKWHFFVKDDLHWRWWFSTTIVWKKYQRANRRNPTKSTEVVVSFLLVCCHFFWRLKNLWVSHCGHIIHIRSTVLTVIHVINGLTIHDVMWQRTRNNHKQPVDFFCTSYIMHYHSQLIFVFISFVWRVTLWWTNIWQWKDPPFFMGKSTISTGPFSIAFCIVHQAG